VEKFFVFTELLGKEATSDDDKAAALLNIYEELGKRIP
jgi:hypothetical protein